MRQIQSLKTGQTTLNDVRCQALNPGQLLISLFEQLDLRRHGERMLVEFGKANLLRKARQQPDKVSWFWTRSGGWTHANHRVGKDQPLTLGYCNVSVARP